MEWIQQLLDNTSLPIVAAFWLGLLTTLSPCPLATNITAIGYISKDIDSKSRVLRNGMLYTLGRIVSYSLLGFVLIDLLHEGSSIFGIQKIIGRYSEMLLPPILILFGLLIPFADKLRLPSFGFRGNGENLKKHNGWGALLLGFLFALAFCPTSGVFYFGMLIPMSVSIDGGYFLPIIFALTTGLPVVILAWILAYSVGSIGNFYGKMRTFQKWFNRLASILCIATGTYYGFVNLKLI